jgi:hypothetical protein
VLDAQLPSRVQHLHQRWRHYSGWIYSEPTSLPQYKINSPAGLTVFFNCPTSRCFDYVGYPNLAAAKWVGKDHKGGCASSSVRFTHSIDQPVD